MGKGGELSTNVVDFVTSVSLVVFARVADCALLISLVDSGVPWARTRRKGRRRIGVAETRGWELENGRRDHGFQNRKTRGG